MYNGIQFQFFAIISFNKRTCAPLLKKKKKITGIFILDKKINLFKIIEKRKTNI